MSSSKVSLEPEFYPIERLLIAGPLADAKPVADRAISAGHTVTLLPPDEEFENAPAGYRILGSGEPIGEDDFDVALELHCANLEAKADVLFYLEDALSEETTILPLTMAISTGELVREMLMPERIAGISLLPPFEESTHVELMATPDTASQTLQKAERLFESLGIKSVRVGDSPGGVLVRTVCCLVNESALAVQERVASIEELDTAMRLGLNYPHGPLEWGDRIGLDKVLAVMDGLYAEFKEERYRPVPLLKKLVRAGQTGVRAGRGFYSY